MEISEPKWLAGKIFLTSPLETPVYLHPPQVSMEIERLIREMEPCLLHGYTSAAGDPEVRTRIASSLSR